MEDDAFRLELGNDALNGDDKGAFFKVVGGLCCKYFGPEKSTGLKDKIERIGSDGIYVSLSRLIVRNVGCIIGSIIELDYFEPYENMNIATNDSDDDYDEDDIEDYAVYTGRRIVMTFDTSDGSFHKSEALAKLCIDELGDHEIDDIELFESIDDQERELAYCDELRSLLNDEAGTPTVDDHFILNTAAMFLDKQ